MSTGQRLVLRPPPSPDLDTAMEIFVAGAYDEPPGLPRLGDRLIVDVGANVGYSLLLWARRFPSARILAFEPHVLHLHQLYSHVVQNDLVDRVEIVAAAASAASGRAYLTRAENESRLVAENSEQTVEVRVTDFFEEIGARKIDLLKLDIEGGEYDILRDQRFARLDVGAIVLEWHNTEAIPEGKAWCTERLGALGYEVVSGALDYGRAGILWAWRPIREI